MKTYNTQSQRISRTLEKTHKSQQIPLETILQKYTIKNNIHNQLTPSSAAPIQMNACIMSRPLETYENSSAEGTQKVKSENRRTSREEECCGDILLNGALKYAEKVINIGWRCPYIPRHWYIKFNQSYAIPSPVNTITDNVGIDKDGYITNESGGKASKLENISKGQQEDEWLLNSICNVNKGIYKEFRNNCRHWVKKVIKDFKNTKSSSSSSLHSELHIL